ncbi:YchJ family metal-binding protein [Corynebacterium breve]|uniref:YchJ family metal-binding protein n=1 Tax=Corynebacterium breve TaxID=3049799 RepID=A0ABY8VH12_9CORY|nr:YchJ family metal-binding protein [Corynebacterium breve]WIM68804.1 YchJ family metal-binding protein [Corynebacterium breve]
MICPCGTGLTFNECCEKYHRGANAPTAEALMRSRFSAFVTKDEDYLLRTWDPATRPEHLDLSDSPVEFLRLNIIDKAKGGLFDDTGVVEFEAFYRGGSQRERSTFRRLDDRTWVYSDGDVS